MESHYCLPLPARCFLKQNRTTLRTTHTTNTDTAITMSTTTHTTNTDTTETAITMVYQHPARNGDNYIMSITILRDFYMK